MDSFRHILCLWPCYRDAAAALGVSPMLIKAWARRNSIPPAHWNAVVTATDAVGSPVTLQQLTDMAERRRAAA